MIKASRKKAVVIGSGFGGLAAAIRTQAKGYEVTLLEMRDKPGGRAYVYEDQGFIYDAGPTIVTVPFILEELAQVAGKKLEDYVSLVPCDPYYRIYFPDDRIFDYSGDQESLETEIARFSPEDVQGYRALRATVPIRIAAGESEHTAFVARDLIASRAVGVIQPDCTRAGGITETRRIAYLAHALNVAYAPHVGGGGAVAAAANLHLAAAMPNFLTYEAMIFPSALRDELATPRVVDAGQISDGTLPVPSGPGLGIEIDPEVVGRFRVE